jgi:hypothetical protein
MGYTCHAIQPCEVLLTFIKRNFIRSIRKEELRQYERSSPAEFEPPLLTVLHEE